MANRNFNSAGKIYSHHFMPVLIDCNFVVDSTNGNGLGIRSLKGPMVKSVQMYSTSPYSPPAGSPALGLSSTMGILAASTITNTGASVISGDIGLYSGTSVTGFPPGTVTGIQHITDATAQQAKIDALAAYTDLSTRSATSISAVLDGQTLTAGVYKEASGTFNLATSGNATLTLSGSATDIFVFQCSSTLTTGAGGIPTITLTGGALASNVYWVCGSSATINVGVTSASATFKGTIIATSSITDTQGGTVSGRLIALTGAVTLSAATTINVPSTNGTVTAGSPAAGTIVVRLEDNYFRVFSGFNAKVAPVSGSSLKVDNSALTAGVAYIITTVGDFTAAQWIALGVPKGVTPAVGVSFIASSVGAGSNTSTSRVMTTALPGSSIMTIETVGDANLSTYPSPLANQGYGAQFIMQCRDNTGTVVNPADGSVISLVFYLSNSSLNVSGE